MRLSPETRSEIKEAIKKGMKAKEIHDKYGIAVPTFYLIKREVFGPARKRTAKNVTKSSAQKSAAGTRRGERAITPAVEVVPLKKIPSANGHSDVISQLSAQMKTLRKTDGLVVRNCGLQDCNRVKKEFGKRWKVLRAKKGGYRSDLFVWKE